VEVNYRGSKVAVKTYRYEVSFLVEVEADNIMIAEQSIAKDGIKAMADPLHSVRTPSPQAFYSDYLCFDKGQKRTKLDWLRLQPSYARLKIVGRSHRRLK